MLNLIQTYTVNLITNKEMIFSLKEASNFIYCNKAILFKKTMEWHFEKDTSVTGYVIFNEKGLCIDYSNFHDALFVKKGDCLRLNFSDTIIHGRWTLGELLKEFEENEMSSS